MTRIYPLPETDRSQTDTNLFELNFPFRSRLLRRQSMEDIQTAVSKLHQGKSSCEDVKRFTELVKQHGRYLEEGMMNAFLKVVFITVRNVLKRPNISALERMYLLDLLEFRARGWSEENSKTEADEEMKGWLETATQKVDQTPEHDGDDITMGPIEISSGDWFSCSVNLKNKYAGTILGRKGCRVDAIRKYTHTRINLSNTHGFTGDDTIREIILEGKEVNIRRAVSLMKLLIKGGELPEEVYEFAEEVKRNRQWSPGKISGTISAEQSLLSDSRSKSPDTERLDLSSVCSWEEDNSPVNFRKQHLSNQTPVQSKQLSDSGHHEDLSPTEREYHNEKGDQKKGLMYSRHILVMGHNLQLWLDDDKLLEEIADLLRGHFGAAKSTFQTKWNADPRSESSLNKSYLQEETKSTVVSLNDWKMEKSSMANSFPLSRGRGRSRQIPMERVQEPKAHGLTERKKTCPFQGFAYAVKELKQFQDRNANARSIHVQRGDEFPDKPNSMETTYGWALYDERQLTSTPAVSHVKSVVDDSGRIGTCDTSPIGSGSEQDSKVELSTLNEGRLMSETDSLTISRSGLGGDQANNPNRENDPKPIQIPLIETERIHESTAPCRTDREILKKKQFGQNNHSLGVRKPLNIIREPINPFTPINVIINVEKKMPVTSLCAAKRRELFASSSPGKSASYKTRSYHVPKYSRQRLFQYSKSDLAKTPPMHWEILTKLYPLICLKEPWGFALDSRNEREHERGMVIRRRNKSEGETVGEAFRSSAQHCDIDDVKQNSAKGDFLQQSDHFPTSATWTIEESEKITEYEYQAFENKRTNGSSIVSRSGSGDSAIGTVEEYASEVKRITRGQGDAEAVKLKTSPSLYQEVSRVKPEPNDGTRCALKKHVTPNADINSGAPGSLASVLDVVQEVIQDFKEGTKKETHVQYQSWPGVTWSKWGVRPKGVKESVAEVIPQPSVSILSRSKSNGGEIHVKKIDPYCMDELLASLCSIESQHNETNHE